MQNNVLFFVLFFSTLSVFSQKEKLIQGNIVVKNSKLDGIRVINLINEKETITGDEFMDILNGTKVEVQDAGI